MKEEVSCYMHWHATVSPSAARSSRPAQGQAHRDADHLRRRCKLAQAQQQAQVALLRAGG
jgi:hypothetical protein